MKRSTRNVFAGTATAFSAIALPATAGSGEPAGCGYGGQMLVCRPIVTVEEVESACFDVEHEYICVPAIRFPWQDDCDPLECGSIRRIRKLKPQSQSGGTRCVVDWVVETVDPGAHCKPLPSRPTVGAARQASMRPTVTHVSPPASRPLP